MNKFIFGLMASAAIALPAFAQQMQQNPPSQSPPAQSPTTQDEIAPNNLSREQIKQLQQSLSEKGFNSGPADGVWGPATADAVRGFQQKQGLQADGRLNNQTLAALGVDAARNRGTQPDPRVSPGAPPSTSPNPGQPNAQPGMPEGSPEKNAPPNTGPDKEPGGPTR